MPSCPTIQGIARHPDQSRSGQPCLGSGTFGGRAIAVLIKHAKATVHFASVAHVEQSVHAIAAASNPTEQEASVGCFPFLLKFFVKLL